MDMTTGTPVPDVDGPSGQSADNLHDLADCVGRDLDALCALLRDLKREIQEEWNKVRSGNSDDKKLTKALKSDLPTLVKLSIEQESRLAKFIDARGESRGDVQFDFDEIREELMGRVIRLYDAEYKRGIAGGIEPA